MKDDRLLEMRVFRSVLETGGFTNAAYALGVSQSFVSQTVRTLERRLGATLLHRSTRGHRLTAEGERFLEAAIAAISAVDKADAEVTCEGMMLAGELRVSAPLAFGLDQIIPLIPEFSASYPDLRLSLTLQDETSDLIGDVIDVAVRMGHLEDSTLISRTLCGLQRIVIASPDYVERNGEPQVPDDLGTFDCLLWQGRHAHLNRWPFEVEGKRQFVTVGGRIRSSNGLTLFELCKDGVGIMRAAEHLARPAIAEGTLVELLADHRADDETAFHIVYLPERQLLPRIRVFVDFMIEKFSSPSWDFSRYSRQR
ncbi:LysR family transcriptional regulator [Fulvimarina sp. 2208YS6-2-32]|uniref:LysR family transcriptional regulator n=1 Tax=Fulvimarina uroteuthidis TaxID=3098149 RepID=A0ABU5I3F8_9HYPH|nr:LysR family transcriptional regulator [Fulvimarina sp. 2208YS6-2-32]MDY8108711.1 LysR family transcriptional regulator [Fulvimarina sp. 2208YS6-2-32]